MDIEKIEKLIELMKANDLAEISLRNGEEEINLRRPGTAPMAVSLPPAAAAAAPAGVPAAEAPPAVNPDDELLKIVSPMVGTFYLASEPESPPFVKAGSSVHPDAVVCILEAMKVFNEIKAEVSGTIEKVLVENGSAVEFGQPLFMVRPN